MLVKRKWLIVGTTFIAAVCIFSYAFLTTRLPSDHRLNKLPDVYRPSVEVLLQESGGSGGALSSALSQANLGALAGLIGGGGGGNAGAQLAQHLLASNIIKDAVAEEFDFITRYSITNKPRSSTRGIISGALEHEFDSGSGILTISYKDTDREFATRVVNRVVQILEDKFRQLTMKGVVEQRQALSATLADEWEALGKAQQDLVDYSIKHGIVDISTQAAAVAEQAGKLRARLTEMELELEIVKQTRRVDDPLVKQLEREIAELRGLIDQVREGFSTYTPVSIPENLLPEVAVAYANLQFEVTLHQTIYTTLRQSLETTILEEKDQTSLFQIVQTAEVPENKYAPSRSKICIIVTITAFFLSVFLAFIREYFERVGRDPQESRKLEEIKRMLWIRRKRSK